MRRTRWANGNPPPHGAAEPQFLLEDGLELIESFEFSDMPEQQTGNRAGFRFAALGLLPHRQQLQTTHYADMASIADAEIQAVPKPNFQQKDVLFPVRLRRGAHR